MIHDIENALVAKVKEILATFGFKVEPFPDNPDNYTMTHPKGVVLVVNKGSAYKGPHNLGTAMQERALSFELTVLVKNLRDHGGAYPVIDALAFGLAGWKAPGAIFGAVLEKDTFISRDASVWTWILQVGIRAYLIPKAPSSEGKEAQIGKFMVKTDQETITVENTHT